MPRVSVIMNVRDGAATLREALASVRTQTFTDWELVVFDDRSRDESAAVVRAVADPRIRYFLAPETVPLGRARDLAIRLASGEWLAFLDQDDVWAPDKLQRQVALAEKDPSIGIVYGRTVMFSARGLLRDFDRWHEFSPLPEGDIFERLVSESCFIAMSSSMLRRSAAEEIGGVPDSIEVIPDYHLFLGVARRYRAAAVQQVVCYYRLHPGNMSLSARRQMHEEVLRLLDAWAPALEPALVARRRRIHHTLVAWAELASPVTAPRGIVRLLRHGSVGWLASRPVARALRALRRRLRRPEWRRRPAGPGEVPPGVPGTPPPASGSAPRGAPSPL
jgi:glycosyltransferase involved in cell wall biosynthesis